ncbi:MAG: nucleoside recognition domain-containing protein [Fimbriimonadales bacterium]
MSGLEVLTSRAGELRAKLGEQVHLGVAEATFDEAARIAESSVKRRGRVFDWDWKLDRILTSRIWGFPIMLGILAVVFWLTIKGANVPSALLADGLFWVEDQLAFAFRSVGAPGWAEGFFVHGIYRGLAWVISVMLPPMAIFFPVFTLLEDLGYLPRVAFNLDRMFKSAGGNGKQALTHTMGFGCNAAGVIATRIIQSPRERLIAIITNNFAPCNGRWPTLIMLATVFVAAAFSPSVGSIVAASTLVGIVMFGVLVALLVSGALSRTVLKGEPSAFALEMPPYRKPQVLRVFYTSLIDRTLFVLWRAIVWAIPCGALAWIMGNTYVGDLSVMAHVSGFLDPFGHALGLDGVILLAYIIAIPANEIVVPTMLMAYMNVDRMIEIDNMVDLKALLVVQHDWTVLTAVCLMLFSLLHNPCSTTIWTIYKETGSKKWTWVATLLPLAIGFLVCFLVATIWRAVG